MVMKMYACDDVKHIFVLSILILILSASLKWWMALSMYYNTHEPWPPFLWRASQRCKYEQ